MVDLSESFWLTLLATAAAVLGLVPFCCKRHDARVKVIISAMFHCRMRYVAAALNLACCTYARKADGARVCFKFRAAVIHLRRS